ncbi:uncharacterized protein F5891DRAFT_986316 [Suillus fuscotomentosus]|uniref:Uncharacterized protein n=1 Tax=Suillus fuscotomentosus TaxID=1912939 RepID=A0AAD4DSC9_9AGAM|nr:uncharacterized protein F5891DRAFT_986316 [Suillus fuscotomentosus]KAG1892936.1 hypothetical protein F5891DRAFT_986316 [Suillus fuscotomentosus]
MSTGTPRAIGALPKYIPSKAGGLMQHLITPNISESCHSLVAHVSAFQTNKDYDDSDTSTTGDKSTDSTEEARARLVLDASRAQRDVCLAAKKLADSIIKENEALGRLYSPENVIAHLMMVEFMTWMNYWYQSIAWLEAFQRVQLLKVSLAWILFYSDGKKSMAATGADSPLGSDKGQIYGGLAKIIFTDHPKYGAAYSSNPKKFRDAVGSHITTQVLFLRNKYKKVKVSFGSTGAGVMPTEGSQAKNLLDAALLELPWYKDLDTIWHSNPLMAMTIHSSKPGIDHAGALYSLVQSNSGAGSSTYFGTTQQSSHPPNVQPLHPPNLSYPAPLHHALPPVSTSGAATTPSCSILSPS